MSKIDELAAIVAAQGEEIAVLRAQLGAQMPATARKAIPAPRTDGEGGVRFLTGREAGEPVLAMPSNTELDRLRAIVDAACPRLAFRPRSELYADSDAAEDHRGFAAAFAWLARQGRVDRVDTKRAPGWYVDGANNWLHEVGRSADVTGRNFVAALLAHGDIAFTPIDDYPCFGITFPGAGRSYSDKWREVLETGQVRQPVAKPGPRPAPPSPSQLLIIGEMPQ